jgi:hypothetical protein
MTARDSQGAARVAHRLPGGREGECMSPREQDHYRLDGITLGMQSSGLARASSGAGEATLGPPRVASLRVATSRTLARRTGWTYLGQAAIHPSNLLMLIGVMFLSLILWNAPVLFIGLGVEGVLLCAVPRSPLFRRRVDEAMDEADRAATQKAREALVLQMGEGHRQELARIEILVGKTFANVERRAGVIPMSFDERLGLGRLTASYIRLAIAHKACEESLAMTNHHALEGTIRSLEAAEHASMERSKPLLRRRLSIAYRRAECWGRTRESLEALGHQLATIQELVHLMHQESIAPRGPSLACDEIDSFLRDFEESEVALRELADLEVEEAV